eukprot:2767530-Amphidinium_carterae.2
MPFFAVFGPHGDCLARNLRFANYTMNPVDRVWTCAELLGPPDFLDVVEMFPHLQNVDSVAGSR